MNIVQIREAENLESLSMGGLVDGELYGSGAEAAEEAAELEIIPGLAKPLYEIEEELTVIFESAGLELAGADLEEQYCKDLGAALRVAVAKRDAVLQFFRHLDSQIFFANQEIGRLKQWRFERERAKERMQGYCIRILEGFERDPRGRAPRLEGSSGMMRLQANPSSVEIVNEGEIPAKFKLTTVTLPAELWERVLDALDLELRADVETASGGGNSRVSISAVGAAIKKGASVPGADLRLGKNRLVIK